MNLPKVIPFLSNPIKLFFFFLAWGTLVFANGLNHPFMIDDHAFFDEAGRDIKNIWINFIPDKAKALHMEGPAVEVYYRPLALVIPKLTYILTFGNAFFMHVFNLLCFVTAAWVLALWLCRISGDILLGVLVAAGVLVHPLNGIIVNFKTAGVFALQMIFMILSADLTLSSAPLVTFLGRGKALRHIWVVVFFMAALFIHESAFILPAYMMALALLLQQESWGKAFQKTKWIWITAIIYFLLRLQWASLSANIFNKFFGYHFGLLQVLASWFSLQAWYLAKVFWPSEIAIFVLRPVVHQGAWLWIIGGVGFWCAVVFMFKKFFGVSLWARLGLIWTALGFVMLGVGSLFHGQELMIEPHWMVFPSIGIFMVLAALFKAKPGPWRGPVAGAALAAWLLSSWVYNYLWDDELRYCRFWLKQSPSFTPINMYIARSYFGRGELDLAGRYYKLALTGQRPDYLMYCNLGTIALVQGRPQEAKQYLKYALGIEPRARNALNALGIIYAREGDFKEAEKYFQLSIQADPFDTTGRRNLDYLYRLQKGGSSRMGGVILEKS